MSVVTIEILKGAMNETSKAEMIKKVSEVVAEMLARPNPKENMLPWVFCIVEEIPFGNFGQNGMAISPELLGAAKAGMMQVVVKK
jgi:phenylpyruvate tautomerase PptA (4-oxalocrotonate tautomerase family)